MFTPNYHRYQTVVCYQVGQTSVGYSNKLVSKLTKEAAYHLSSELLTLVNGSQTEENCNDSIIIAKLSEM